ncbi:MAG: AbrB family transcriptional regulator [Candidatus Aegiribacteria sp.]|nr:AbrB family transcriptional regulator [Candidatus Aegiribacteria sp.]MBD3295240.1 AbrB family transcriptional regulator [Candidatus Fermentibacteria bacterium]
MNTVKLSPKYQIVIPKRIRERMSLKPGELFEVIGFEERIELIPVRPMSSVRGFLKDADPSFSRDERDRV